MARSNRRLGEKIRGVSTRITWLSASMAMPRMRLRVVCTLGVTIETFEPTSALIIVDFPTFGAPISAAKPQRRAACPASAITTRRLDALARQHGGGRGLFGGPLGAAESFGRRKGRKLHRHPEFWTVGRPRPPDLTAGRRGPAT